LVDESRQASSIYAQPTLLAGQPTDDPLLKSLAYQDTVESQQSPRQENYALQQLQQQQDFARQQENYALQQLHYSRRTASRLPEDWTNRQAESFQVTTAIFDNQSGQETYAIQQLQQQQDFARQQGGYAQQQQDYSKRTASRLPEDWTNRQAESLKVSSAVFEDQIILDQGQGGTWLG
jgi:hypothetical protein